MLQLSADISVLSTIQRKAVADFILTFPHSTPEHNEDADDTEIVHIPAFSIPSDDEPSPEEAFTAAPTTAADTLDKAGLPWDSRIHAGSRTKTENGLWKKKRGIDSITVSGVEGELRKLMAIPAPVAVSAASIAETLGHSYAVPHTPAPPPPPPPANPTVAAAEPTAAAVPSAPVAGGNAFIDLITKASLAVGQNKLTQEQITAACVSCGIPALPLLANRLDLVPQVSATIDAYMMSAGQ